MVARMLFCSLQFKWLPDAFKCPKRRTAIAAAFGLNPLSLASLNHQHRIHRAQNMDPSAAAQTLLASPSLPAETLRVIATLLGNLAREPTNEKFARSTYPTPRSRAPSPRAVSATEVLPRAALSAPTPLLECAPGVGVGVLQAAPARRPSDACSEAAAAPFALPARAASRRRGRALVLLRRRRRDAADGCYG